MRIAVFGKSFGADFNGACSRFFKRIDELGWEVVIYKPFYDFLLNETSIVPSVDGFYQSHSELTSAELVFSIGGDGTFLEAVTLVRNSGIPIVGINSGRLGFLADISQTDIDEALDEIFASNYNIKELELLQVETEESLFGDLNYALNELSVHKRDSSSMITIHAYLDNEFLNSYWADGLIVATPTGSTAYSLSVGGPIMHPSADCFVITPIAPHNLTVRPLVVPNGVELMLRIEGRGDNYMASLDSRSHVLDHSVELRIKRSSFKIKIIELSNQSFYSTLRNKLMWGVDKRN